MLGREVLGWRGKNEGRVRAPRDAGKSELHVGAEVVGGESDSAPHEITRSYHDSATAERHMKHLE